MSTRRRLPAPDFVSANDVAVGDVVEPLGRQRMTPAPRAAQQALISRATMALVKPPPWTRRRNNGAVWLALKGQA